MKILVDTFGGAVTPNAWAERASDVASRLVGLGHEVFLVGNPGEIPESEHGKLRRLDFPRRIARFADPAAEAELLTRMATHHEIDLFVSAGSSYVLGIPSVVAAVGMPENHPHGALDIAFAIAQSIVADDATFERVIEPVAPHVDAILVETDPAAVTIARAVDVVAQRVRDGKVIPLTPKSQRLLQEYQVLHLGTSSVLS